jgi:hypothetical protein
MKVRVIASLVMALCLAVGSANASSIGIFFAPDASDCDTQVMPFVSFSTYVIAILGGDAAGGGITGAEYKLNGIDPAWFNNVTPSPAANVVLGSPLDVSGCNIAFPSCQGGGAVLLHSISSLALAAVTERTLSITARNPPPNPNFNCPLVTLCDAEFTKLCLAGGEAFINRSVPCTVGVSQATWSQVKGLYSN